MLKLINLNNTKTIMRKVRIFYLSLYLYILRIYCVQITFSQILTNYVKLLILYKFLLKIDILVQ